MHLGSGRAVGRSQAAALRQPECCGDSRSFTQVGILGVSDQHKENKCAPRRNCLWDDLALRSGQGLLQEPSGVEGGCGLQSTQELRVGLTLKVSDPRFP